MAVRFDWSPAGDVRLVVKIMKLTFKIKEIDVNIDISPTFCLFVACSQVVVC